MDELDLTDEPDAETFAAINVLHPPAESKMIERFARVELTA